jgi:hypothetical protein
VSIGEVVVNDGWDAIERCYDEGWTDGLPVVPPTEAMVADFLEAVGWSGDEVVLREPVRSIEVPSVKVVVNAILAGCRPVHVPVVAAALRAMSHPDFKLHLPASSTGGAAPVIVVNGPIRHTAGINCAGNLFGSGRRANAVIGRAVRLVLMNCVGAVPGILDMATQGWFGKYTACFGEREEVSPWPPLHVRRGFAAEVSTVTVLATESGHNVHTRSGVDADGWLYTAGDVLHCLGSHSDGQGYLVIGPEHAAILGASGLTVTEIQRHLFEASRRTIAELRRAGRIEGDIVPGDDERTRPRGRTPDDIIVLVGGGDAGCSSAWFPTWSRGRGSVAVTAPVDPDAGAVVSSEPGPADAPGLGDGT